MARISKDEPDAPDVVDAPAVATSVRFRDTRFASRTVALPSAATVLVEKATVLAETAEAIEYLTVHADFERLE